MNRTITSGLLAITLTLGCGGVAVGQAHNTTQDVTTRIYLEAFHALGRKDYATAERLHRRLAVQGSTHSLSVLAWMYLKGKGVVQNYKEAAKLYRLAAAKGDELAQYNLGMMYKKGQGVLQDYQRAHMWLNLAATDTTTSFIASPERDVVSKLMTPAQIAEAQAMARKCQASNFKQCN
jgi:hypothetical protein